MTQTQISFSTMSDDAMLPEETHNYVLAPPKRRAFRHASNASPRNKPVPRMQPSPSKHGTTRKRRNSFKASPFNTKHAQPKRRKSICILPDRITLESEITTTVTSTPAPASPSRSSSSTKSCSVSSCSASSCQKRTKRVSPPRSATPPSPMYDDIDSDVSIVSSTLESVRSIKDGASRMDALVQYHELRQKYTSQKVLFDDLSRSSMAYAENSEAVVTRLRRERNIHAFENKRLTRINERLREEVSELRAERNDIEHDCGERGREIRILQDDLHALRLQMRCQGRGRPRSRGRAQPQSNARFRRVCGGCTHTRGGHIHVT